MKSAIKNMVRLLKIGLFGRLRVAKKQGLKCGNNVTVMGGVNFGSEPYLISLGDNVRISSDVLFVTHDGGSWVFRREGKFKDVVRFGRINIGSNVFIGARSVILPGVRIGNNCVVAAGCVVTKSFPDGSVIAGVPGRVISDIDTYALKMKSRMPNDWDSEQLLKNKRSYLEGKIPNEGC